MPNIEQFSLSRRHRWREICNRMVATQGGYGFSIRGQQFNFATRDEYLEHFGRALDIAKEQEKRFEGVPSDPEQLELDLEEALIDSDQDQTVDEDTLFERRIEERFSDDVDPMHR